MNPADYVVWQIWRDLNHPTLNKNKIILITGLPRTGKSFIQLKLSESLDVSYTANTLPTRLFFDPKLFIKRIKKDSPKKGQIFNLDDLGVQYSPREWQSIGNKVLGKIFQTFGFLNIGLICTVPHDMFIDSTLRRLVHIQIETIYIDDITNECVARFYFLNHNVREAKSYYWYPHYVDKYGMDTKISTIRIPMPSRNIYTKFIEMETQYKKSLIDKADDDLDGIEAEIKPKHREHAHSWYARLKENDWRCKSCGVISKISPF